MAQITWKNVNDPDFGTAASLARSGGQAVQGGIDRLAGVVGDINKQAIAAEQANTPEAIFQAQQAQIARDATIANRGNVLAEQQFQQEQDRINRERTVGGRGAIVAQDIFDREQAKIAQEATRAGRESIVQGAEFGRGQQTREQAETIRTQGLQDQQLVIDDITSKSINAMQGTDLSLADQSTNIRNQVKQAGGTSEQVEQAIEQNRLVVNREKLSTVERGELDSELALIDSNTDTQLQIQQETHNRLVQSLPVDRPTTPEEDRAATASLNTLIDQQVGDLWFSGNDSVDIKAWLDEYSRLPGVTPSMLLASYSLNMDVTGGGFFGKIDKTAVKKTLDEMVANPSPELRQQLITDSQNKLDKSILGSSASKLSQKSKFTDKYLRGLGAK